MQARVLVLVMLSFFGVSHGDPPSGEGSLLMPKELVNTDIEDKAGAVLPLDLKLINQDGKATTLGHYVGPLHDKPVILTLGYFGCPKLCSLVLNELIEALAKISFSPGEDFRLVSVSIDDREDSIVAKRKQIAYLASLRAPPDADWWQFHVTSAEEAKRLADAVGFHYKFDQKTDQFAHSAGFFVLSPQGVLSRTFFGLSYNPSDLKLALTEAAKGNIGSFVDRIILSCFHYDKDSHRYGVYILGVMRVGGIATIMILAGLLLVYFRQERKRNQALM